MPQIKRWAPLLGTAVLVAATVLRLLGQEDVAKAVETAGQVTGTAAQSPVSGQELAALVTQVLAAAAAATGIVLKIAAQVRKAREGQ